MAATNAGRQARTTPGLLLRGRRHFQGDARGRKRLVVIGAVVATLCVIAPVARRARVGDGTVLAVAAGEVLEWLLSPASLNA